MRTCVFGVLFLVLPLAAQAQDAADPAAEASRLIDEGVELRRGGDDVTALARFEQAYELAPSPRAAAQLGLAHQALGAWIQADARLREALSNSEDPFVQEFRGALEASHAAVREQIGQLQVLGGVDGAAVRFGGRTVGTLPMREPVTVMIGTSPLEVSAEGYHTVEMELTVRAGQLTRQMVELEPMPPAPPEVQTTVAVGEPAPAQREPPADDGGSVLESWWLWTIIGVAVAGGVAVGIVVGTQSGGTEPPLEGTLGTSTALVRF